MSTATLIDGRQVPSDSEEWRAECFERFFDAKRIVALETDQERRYQIAQVRVTRGDEAALRLRKVTFSLMQGAKP